MARTEQAAKNEKWDETGARWLRNINILGAVAFYGAGAAVGSEILKAYGVFNGLQAGFFEGLRRWFKKRKVAPTAGRLSLKPS